MPLRLHGLSYCFQVAEIMAPLRSECSIDYHHNDQYAFKNGKNCKVLLT